MTLQRHKWRHFVAMHSLSTSTLRLHPQDSTRMTRDRSSLLRLHRGGLAPSTFRRSPAHPFTASKRWSSESLLACEATCFRKLDRINRVKGFVYDFNNYVDRVRSREGGFKFSWVRNMSGKGPGARLQGWLYLNVCGHWPSEGRSRQSRLKSLSNWSMISIRR